MSYSEALKAVNKAYVPGVVAFYDKMKPNPWQDAHDALERAIDAGLDDHGRARAAKNFQDRLIQLISAYRAASIPQPRHLDVRDGLTIAPTEADRLASVKQRICYACETGKDLTIEAAEPGSAKVRLVCQAHKAPKSGVRAT